jgi:hypothetical protein
MNLWDSVQRGLEKATQEAGRIAKTQRLRATVDGLNREINIQSGTLVGKTMELFLAGHLTQAEILPICQEIARLQQQLAQTQNELKLAQANTPPNTAPPPPGAATPYPPPPTIPAQTLYPPAPVGSSEPTIYAPPPPGYEPYTAGGSDVTAPPPPGMEGLTLSQIETMALNTMATPGTGQRRCTNCQAALTPTDEFCHTCGTPARTNEAEHSPTIRAETTPTVAEVNTASEEAQKHEGV